MYSTGCKRFMEKSVEQILALAEEMCEAQISGVGVNALGKCHCSLPFSYTLPRTFAAVHSQKQDTGLEGSLISPYASLMIAQSAPSVTGCIWEGTNCGSAGTQQRDAKGCENSSCVSVLDAGVKDQIVRGRAILLCRVMTLLCARRKELDWQEL